MPDVEELAAGEPRALVIENALRKARAVAGELVLGADTRGRLGDRVLGKPADAEQAGASCARCPGVARGVVGDRPARAGAERTAAALTRSASARSGAEIAWYLATGEWRDRAGGYAIQGRARRWSRASR